MLSINQLMKYLRNHHQISVKSNQAQSLRNIGYYHGYKGYRFIRTPNQRIPFSSLDEKSSRGLTPWTQYEQNLMNYQIRFGYY